ncbi:MAG: complement C1q protein, partial [uncultured bacterium]
ATQDSFLSFSTALDGTVAERMRITSGGRIGIGTISPASQLSVNTPENSGETRLLLQLIAEQTGRRPRLNFASYNTQTGEKYIALQTDADDGVFPPLTLQSSGGNVGIGITNPGAKLEVNSSLSQTPFVIRGGGSSGIEIIRILDASGNEKMRIDNSGNIGIGTTNATQKLTVYNGSTTGTYTTSGWAHSSDARLKTNIQTISDPLTKIMKLNPVSFNWKNNPDENKQIGFIAQEMLETIPEIVIGNEEDGYGIAYGNLSSMIVGAIQEQQLEITNNKLQISNEIQNSNDQIELQTESIASLQLKTDQNITTLSQLQTSIDTQLGVVQMTLSGLQNENQKTQADLTDLETTVQTLQSQIQELQQIANQELNLAQIDQNSTDISYLKTLLGINPDKPNEISILGKLTAENIESGILTIKVADQATATIGTAIICPLGKKADESGTCSIDDEAADGKSVVVKTGAVSKESKIFVTPKNVTDKVLAVTETLAGEGFMVKIKEPIGISDNPIEFDWWMVESN